MMVDVAAEVEIVVDVADWGGVYTAIRRRDGAEPLATRWGYCSYNLIALHRRPIAHGLLFMLQFCVYFTAGSW